jgi:short-subunit dehydrogenase
MHTPNTFIKKALIIGATSGIGEELASQMIQGGYSIGITGRREDRLRAIQSLAPERIHIKVMDIADTTRTTVQLRELLVEMDGADIIVISAGTGHINPSLDWAKEKETIDVNVSGFTALACAAFEYFCTRGSGLIAGISSIAAIRGGRAAPAYNASKAFVSNYLEGLRQKAVKMKLPITVTEIQPGFVDTAMASSEILFWVATPAKAAKQILAAIETGKPHVYITKRWRFVAWLLKLVPSALYCRF